MTTSATNDWRSEWILAGPRSQWTAAQNAAAFDHARYRFLITLEDDELRAFPNVCRHRGAPLLAAGWHRQSALRCGYHGWTYGLAGELRHVPGRDGFDEDLEARCALPPVPLVEVDGLVWIAVADAPNEPPPPPPSPWSHAVEVSFEAEERPWEALLVERQAATGGLLLGSHAIVAGEHLEVVRPGHHAGRSVRWCWRPLT